MERFYWLKEGRLAGCSRPGGTGLGVAEENGNTGAGNGEQLAVDLGWLRGQGIASLLSLTELSLDATALADEGFTCLHIPVPDLTAPLPEQFHRALGFIDQQWAEGQAVAIHCLQGQGRTGSVLAAFLIREGTAAADAIAALRALCPGALSSPAQEEALHAFAGRRDWIL